MTVRIGYVYPVGYLNPGDFAFSFGWINSLPDFLHIPGRLSITVYQTWHGTLGGWDDALADEGLGGWTLDVHHSYDVGGRVLYQGDGTTRRAQAVSEIISSAAGARSPAPDPGEGMPAREVQLGTLQDAAFGPDGSLYIADGERVVHVGLDGLLHTVAGNGQGCLYSSANTCGDGGPATAAELGISGPRGIAVGPDGSIYIADTYNNRIRRVGPNGIIATVAGGGAPCGDPGKGCGDGGPATQAVLGQPQDVALGPDGSLYIADTFDDRIRRVDTHGIITTVAGDGSPNCVSGVVTPSACFGGDGGQATQAELFAPYGVAVASDGSFSIADANNNRIRRVDTHGIITTVAGNGSPGCTTGASGPACYGGDGGPATAARLNTPQDVALGSDGTLYIADTYNNRVRRVETDGTITTMVGNGTQGQSGDGGPAIWATITQPGSVTVGPDGDLYLTGTQDGRVRRVGAGGTIGTAAGWDAHGDGSPAMVAALGNATALTTGSDGSMYFVDLATGTVRRIDPDETITTFAGGGPSCSDPSGDCGDGGPATQATLNLSAFSDLAVGPDGGLYITDGARVRRVGPDGIISTVAGTGQVCDASTQNPATYCGDGGPATAAQFVGATGLAFGPGGAMYVMDFDRVRAIMPDGTIRTVAGGGTAFPGDGQPATQVKLSTDEKIAVGPDGTLYIADRSRLVSVAPDGILSTVAGQPYATCSGSTDPCGDGGPATQAELGNAVAVTLGSDGALYIVDQGVDRIRRVAPEGIIATVAGGSGQCNPFGSGPIPLCGDGGPATDAQLSSPNAATVRPDGSLCIGDDARIRCLGPALPGLALDGSVIPSADGSELYVFDANGRHLRTLDALTLAVRFQFGYDSAGHLVTVTDGDGNVTTIQRDGSGRPVAIVAPGGQRTTLTTDANGYLASIADPAGDTTRLASTADGLLTSLTDPNGNVYTYGYDDEGRLARDTDPAGGVTTLARIDGTNAYTVTATTALSRTTTYTVQQLPGGVVRETTIDPSGARTVLDVGTDDSRTITYPDGAREVQTLGPDPRFGDQAPIVTSDVFTTPAGLVNTVLTTRTVVLANPDDPLALQSLTDMTSTNGRTTTSVYDATTRIITVTSAAGRKAVVTLDGEGRPILQVADASMAPIAIRYDAKGRLATAQQGSQSVTLSYDAANRLTARTDAAGNVTRFGYDNADRVVNETLPGGETYQFTYDANGNLTAVVMPSGAKHTLAYTSMDQVASFTPPGNAAYSRQYDRDGNPTTLTLPDGRSVTSTYDAAGRPTGLTSADGAATYTYADATDRISQITGTASGGPAQGIAIGYDGGLLTSLAVSGTAQGSFTYSYDANFALTGITLSSGSDHLTIPFSYDGDRAPTGVGPFTIAPNGPGGAPGRIGDGTWSRTLSYDALAQTTAYTDTVGGSTAYAAKLGYDNLGRPVSRVETMAGASHTYAYTYDADGQLTKVTRDGTTVEQYAYDANGNRTSVQLSGNPVVSATYDTQDRLQQQGGTPYSFDADGYLTRRGDDTFSYNARGDLLTATVGGQTVTYAYDGLGRRIGRTDGTGTTSYLYGNPNNPFQVTAVRDPSGTLSMLNYDAGGLLIAVERGGTRYYVSTDLLGTPRVVADGAGHALKTIQYDSFGNVTAIGGSTPGFFLPIGFAGGLSDAVTGLVHFGFRDYDPIAGRWTARDPSLYAGGQGNLYAYVGNDPVGHYDPWGLFGAFGYQIQMPGWVTSAADWVSSKVSDWLTSKVDSVQTGPVTWSVNAQERTISASTSATLNVDGQAVAEAEVEGYVGITRYTDLHCPLFKAGVKASWKQKLVKLPGIGKLFSGSIQREVEFGQVQDFTDPNVNTEFGQLQQVDYNGAL